MGSPLYGGLTLALCQHFFWDEHGFVGLSRTQIMIANCALARGDKAAAESFLRDWRAAPEPVRKVTVSKWVPGSHYYVLGEKFDTYALAVQHATAQGYVVEGLREQHVYTRGGD